MHQGFDFLALVEAGGDIFIVDAEVLVCGDGFHLGRVGAVQEPVGADFVLRGHGHQAHPVGEGGGHLADFYHRTVQDEFFCCLLHGHSLRLAAEEIEASALAVDGVCQQPGVFLEGIMQGTQQAAHEELEIIGFLHEGQPVKGGRHDEELALPAQLAVLLDEHRHLPGEPGHVVQARQGVGVGHAVDFLVVAALLPEEEPSGEQDAQGDEGHQADGAHGVEVDEGKEGAGLAHAVGMPGDDAGNLLALQVRDFLVQDGQEPGVGVAGHTYGNLVGKDHVACGVEVQVATGVDVVLYGESLGEDDVSLPVIHRLQAVLQGGIVVYLGGGVLVLRVGPVVEMASGAGNHGGLRQGPVTVHHCHIVNLEVGLGEPDFVLCRPVVVVVGVGYEVNLAAGHGLAAGFGALEGGSGDGEAQVSGDEFHDVGDDAQMLPVLEVGVGGLSLGGEAVEHLLSFQIGLFLLCQFKGGIRGAVSLQQVDAVEGRDGIHFLDGLLQPGAQDLISCPEGHEAEAGPEAEAGEALLVMGRGRGHQIKLPRLQLFQIVLFCACGKIQGAAHVA